MRKRGVRRGRRRSGARRRWSEVKGVCGVRGHREDGALEGCEWFPKPLRERRTASSFIRAHLAAGLNPSHPSPQSLLGRPPKRLLDLGPAESAPRQGGNSSPRPGFPLHMLRPPSHSGPYLFAKVQKEKKKKIKNRPFAPAPR